MFITYRRTGGVFAIVIFAVVALATAVLTVVTAATVLLLALALGAAALVARAILPASLRKRTVSDATPWPQKTIETTLATPAASSDEGRTYSVVQDNGEK